MSEINIDDLNSSSLELLLHGLKKRGAKRYNNGRSDPIVVVSRNVELTLSLAQQRLWFLAQLDASAGAAYHIPAALRLTGKLDTQALQATLDRIVARHESLRTTFVELDGQAVQRIAAPSVGFALARIDLTALDKAQQEEQVVRLGEEERSRPFDLGTGPLIRGALLKLAEHEHVLLVTQHHIVSDGWSIGILVREVSALYSAFSQDKPDPLPELEIQYADYAHWQRNWLKGEVLEQQLG
ncbi:condensation domain-containing protein, partial [Massilia phyllosphaerae]|uniref:condensation domain-containing protein n=1 Tax=Massilia phyllosphaerae TaxID=3106034 RepID=UPI002B1CADEC